MQLDIQEQFNSIFKDAKWMEKLGLLSLSSFFFITAPAVAGYQMELIQDSVKGETDELPEIGSNFGALWTKGLLLSLILTVLMVAPLLFVGGFLFSTTFFFTGHAALFFGWLIMAALVFCGLAIALAIPMPALILNYVVTQKLSSLWDVRAAFEIMKRSTGDYAVIAALPLGAAVLSTMVSTTGIGAILSVPLFCLAWMVQGKMLGEYHRKFFQ